MSRLRGAPSPCGVVEIKGGFAWWALALSFWTLAISVKNTWPSFGTLGYKHFLSWWSGNDATTHFKSLLGTSWAHLVQLKWLFQILCQVLKNWKWVRSCLCIGRAHRNKKKNKRNIIIQSLLIKVYMKLYEGRIIDCRGSEWFPGPFWRMNEFSRQTSYKVILLSCLLLSFTWQHLRGICFILVHIFTYWYGNCYSLLRSLHVWVSRAWSLGFSLTFPLLALIPQCSLTGKSSIPVLWFEIIKAMAAK